MSRSILIIAPEAQPGQPVAERVRAFISFFEEEGIRCQIYPSPRSFWELVALIRHIYKKGWRNLFVTMPPFRNWCLCFLPKVKTILDIRDGWSIAMRRGYGGQIPPNRAKAWLARVVEQAAIRCCFLTIACTPGLLHYHATKGTRDKILLIPNGFPSGEFAFVEKLRRESPLPTHAGEITFICAGKFSQYGVERAKEILIHIGTKFRHRRCALYVYSNNPKDNCWINEFLRKEKIYNISFYNMDSIGREDVLRKIVNSDYGIAALRDESYEFGTKIFDYIVCGTPVLDVFKDGAFRDFFRGYFDTDYKGRGDVRRFLRGSMIRDSTELHAFLRRME